MVAWEDSGGNERDIFAQEFDLNGNPIGGTISLADIPAVQIENAIGGSGDDSISGSTANNSLRGGDGNDTLAGWDGHDTLEGGQGNDSLLGDAGNDRLLGEDGDDILEGAQGNDSILGGDGDDAITDLGGGNDTMDGGAGSDTIHGGEGNDSILGGANSDTLDGENGNDTIDGGDGSDEIFGNVGNDSLKGGLGSDEITGGLGADVMEGGDGNDTYHVDNVGDKVVETATDNSGLDTVISQLLTYSLTANVEYLYIDDSTVGNAAFTGNALANTIEAGDGNDTLKGGLGNDFLLGEDGNDSLDGEGGNDTLDGGLGNDTYVVESLQDEIRDAFFNEDDEIYENAGTDTILYKGTAPVTIDLNTISDGFVENVTLLSTGTAAINVIGTDADSDPEHLVAGHNAIFGNAGANSLSGGSGNDTLDGGGGNDTLIGGTGDDSLTGGAGKDSLDGGEGSDTYVVDNMDFTVLDTGVTGTDTVIANFNYSLGAGLENLTLTGTAAAGTGNAGNNVITGNASNNTLIGGDGNDNLSGDAGNDSLSGGNGNDTLSGGDGNDTLNAGTGAADLAGGTGNDTYIIDNAGTALVGITEAAGTSGGVDTVDLSATGLDLALDMQTTGFGVVRPEAYSEFLVNETTEGAQNRPRVAALPGGEFLVTWTDNSAGNDNVRIERYDYQTLPYGGQGNVTSTVADAQGNSAIQVFDDGSYLLVWNGNGQSDTDGIYFQRFDDMGTPVGSETLVNTTTAQAQSQPNAAILSDGSFVITWQSGDGNDKDIFAQRFDANGDPAGTEFQVNTTSADNQAIPVITAINGGFVIVWESWDPQDGNSWGVIGQRYDENGVPQGDEFVVNTSTTGFQFGPDVATLRDGNGDPDGFVVTWTSNHAGNFNVYAQRYDVDGMAIGGEIAVNTTTQDAQESPSVTGLANGEFVITWQSSAQDGGGKGIYGQRFNADGTKNGAEFLINVTTGGDQQAPVISALSDGGFIVAWESVGQDGSDAGIYAKRYDDQGNAVVIEPDPDLFMGGLANVENLFAGGGDDMILGNAAANLLRGNGGNDTLEGGLGNDTLEGGLGNDTLNGGSGKDVMTGGVGDDTYTVDDAGDVINEDASVNSGTDKVMTSLLTYSLKANLENLELTAIGNGKLTGNAANNLITGGIGDDTIDGGVGDDTLNGGAGGSDSLLGGAGNDRLVSGGGHSTLNGGVGNDTLVGGTGNDTFIVDSLDDSVEEGYFDVNNNVLDRGGEDTIEWGVNAAGTVDLSQGLKTVIENVKITSAATVHVIGNDLDNRLTGNAAAQSLTGGDGNDVLTGNAGKDTLDGGDGDDTYYIDALDSLIDSDGNDTIVASFNYSLASASLGNAFENLTLTGTAATGTGNDGDNRITGNAAANTLTGGGGQDTLDGGGGNDTYIMDGDADPDTVTDIGGIDTADFSAGVGGLQINLETGLVTTLLDDSVAEMSAGEIENALGTAGDDSIRGSGAANRLIGNDGNDHIFGGNGNDTLLGGAGNDTLDGQDGDDSMTGGAGDDTYAVTTAKEASSLIAENANEGVDTVITSVLTNVTLRANFENLTYTGNGDATLTGNTVNNSITGGTGNDSLKGDAGADTLTGGSGDDTLDGGVGADSMIGGFGNDTYVIDNVGDTFLETVTVTIPFPNTFDPGSIDTVNYAINTPGIVGMSSGEWQNIENVKITSAAAIHVVGNDNDNRLEGNASAQSLSGGDGNDTLIGGGGKDTLIGDDGDDTYVIDNLDASLSTSESLNGGTDTVEANFTYSLLTHFENLTLTGTTAINGTGNAADNHITGNGAANVLDGKGGNDTLEGGAGNDTYKGNVEGVTTIIETSGVDTVDYSAYTGALEVDLGNAGTIHVVPPLSLVENTAQEATAIDNNHEPQGVTYLSDGRYVAVSLDYNGGQQVVAQVFDADGTPNGEFEVSDPSVSSYQPVVQALPDGAFAIVWTYDGQTGDSGDGVYGKVFFANGTSSDEFHVNTTTTLAQNTPRITLVDDTTGAFLVTWEDHYKEVYGQFFDADGEKSGGEFEISDGSNGSSLHPMHQVTRLENGNIAVTFYTSSGGSGAPTSGYQLRIYEPNGTLVSVDETKVFNFAISDPVIAPLSGGGFVIAATSAGSSPYAAYYRAYNANGVPLTASPVALSPLTGSDNGGDVQIATQPDGRTLMVWMESHNAENTLVKGQFLNGNGTVSGTAFTISPSNTDADYGRVTALTNGDYVVTWAGHSDSLGGNGVFGRYYNANGVAMGSEFTIDGSRAFSPNDDYRVSAGADGRFVVSFEGGDVNNGGTFVREYTLSEGVPTLIGTVTANQIENFIGGSGNDLITGNLLNNSLTGGAGDDTLNGGLGVDTLVGGLGNDTYVIDNVNDTVTELATAGAGTADRIMIAMDNFVIGAKHANVEFFEVTGSTGRKVTGSATNNDITGGAGNDTLDGAAGNDLLSGGDGDDSLLGGAGNDTISGGAGSNYLAGGVGNDSLTGGDDGDLFFYNKGDGKDVMIDAAGDNQLAFGAGILKNNVAFFKSGNDLQIAFKGAAADGIIVVDQFNVDGEHGFDTITLGQTGLSLSRDQLNTIIDLITTWNVNHSANTMDSATEVSGNTTLMNDIATVWANNG